MARYGDLKAAVGAKGGLFRGLASASYVLVCVKEAVLLICAWIFLPIVGLEQVLEGVLGAAAQRQNEVGESERICEARSGVMMVMRCRS